MSTASRWIFATALLLGLTTLDCHAQLQTLSSHYFLNQLTFNPAAAGSDKGVNIFANYRAQWVGIDGSPQTQTLAADMSLPMISSGAGFTVTNDLIGAERHTSVRANFAYFLDLGKKYKIGFGVAGGFVNTSIDGNKLTTPDGSDDFLPQGKVGLIRPDLAVGVLVRSKELKVGLSYNNLIRSATIDGAVSSLETKYGSYFNLFAAYKATFGGKFSLEPSVLVRTDFVNWQTDVGAMFDYKDFIFSGVFFRGYNNFAIDAFYATVGLKPVGMFSVFYSYDLGLSPLNDVHNGSHEISIRVFIPEHKLFKRGKIIYNPRYL
jgi:type IX secretion system PorP/SprF family membrane protein